MSFATLLAHDQVKRVHEAALEILEEVGLKVRYEPARELFKQHGCNVEDERVKFPRKIIEKYRKLYPPTFTFGARDPRFDKTIPQDSPVIVTASSAPDIIDPVTGVERRAKSVDIARIAHLINELPGYDVFSISTLADDAPADQFTISRLYPAIKYCLKPIRVTTTDMKDTMDVMKMTYLVAGGEEAYKAAPVSDPSLLSGCFTIDNGQAFDRECHVLCERGTACLPDHCSECRTYFAHVHGRDDCAGQR